VVVLEFLARGRRMRCWDGEVGVAGNLAGVDSEAVGISMVMMGDLVDVAEDLEKGTTKDREVHQEEVEDTG